MRATRTVLVNTAKPEPDVESQPSEEKRAVDFVDAVRLLRRRWIVFFGVLIPLGALALVYVAATPAKYQATADVGFVGASVNQSTPSAVGVNPLTPTDVSLMAYDDLTSEATAQSEQARGDAGYSVTDPTNNASPVLSITATSTSPATALRTVRDLIAIARQSTAARQRSVGASQQFWNRVILVTGPGPVSRVSAGKVRAAAALAIVAIILAVGAAFIADNRSSRRTRKSLLPVEATSDLGYLVREAGVDRALTVAYRSPEGVSVQRDPEDVTADLRR